MVGAENESTLVQDVSTAYYNLSFLDLMYCSSRETEMPFRKVAYDDFNNNIRMLNESMGLCIPIAPTILKTT